MKTTELFKQYLTLSLISLTIVILVHSCTIADHEPTALPPITQTGANTFGCYINGEIFTNMGGGEYLGNPYAILQSGSLRMRIEMNTPTQREDLYIYIDSIFTMNPILFDTNRSYIEYRNRIDSCVYRSDFNNGLPYQYFEITKFDTVKNIISGLFEFDIKLLYGNTCDSIIEVRDGRFDINFIAY